MSIADPSDDYPQSRGGAALGARLRRLSERIDRDADRLYAELGVEFEQRWFGVLNQLALNGPMAVGQLADALGVSHAAISQTRASLLGKRLIEIGDDVHDARKRVLRLSADGVALVRRLAPVWGALEAVASDLAASAPGLIEALDRLEAALDRRSLRDRALDEMAG
ncbi:MAG: MarR family transcriptional regulator [Alphaproteobacteria bacterium]|nr:MarR family transcriptional regulator [Alphaproteobacteria bacterium]